MKFYVIYWFDCVKEQSVKRYQPTKLHRFNLTEEDDQYDYDYLGEEYENGKHRKYTALLTKEQFETFLADTCLYADEVETMGSLTEFGHLPAIMFNRDYMEYDDAIDQAAYVTPLPENWFTNEPIEKQDERNWGRVKRAVVNTYSD